MRRRIEVLLFLILFPYQTFAQQPPLNPAAPNPEAAAPATSATNTSKDVEEESPERPNGRRIRRHLNLIIGVEHDEELLIPRVDLGFKGRVELIDIKRIKGTDFFRIFPKKVSNGIVTIHNKKTGQILVELRIDVRNDEIEKNLREVQSLLGDIEGIEFKIVNGVIVIDGYAIIPKDLIRIAQVIKTMNTSGDQPKERVKSLVSLSPIARKKIMEYITKDVNNPEVSITTIGDMVKIEGVVNSADEQKRIHSVICLYMPDIVVDLAPDTDTYQIKGKKTGATCDDLIKDLTTVRPPEEKTEPPPKMIQIVTHFVEYNENYLRSFSFQFSPSLRDNDPNRAANSASPGSLTETFNLLDRLMPKLNWAKKHGYVRVLDTGSILVQDRKNASLNRVISVKLPPQTSPQGQGGVIIPEATAVLNINTTPVIKSERSGLIEFQGLTIKFSDPIGQNSSATTDVKTTISVRDRQSAAFAGTIKKKRDTDFGGPTSAGSVITLNHGKSYTNNSSNFVVFITPIIKASASTGVDQVKKKFRLKD